MKKIICCLLIALLIFSTLALSSCSNYYDPVPPTEEEDKTVIKTGAGEIKYDLFRALYLASKTEGITPEQAAAEALEKASRILAIFAECERLGLDTDSNDIMNKVDDIIVASVDGGEVDGVNYAGHGSFDNYLASLRSVYLTDRVNRLITQAYLCEQLLIEHYLAKENIPAESDVRAYFLSDDCIRITWLATEYDDVAASAHARLAGKGESEIIRTLIQYSSASASSYENGWYIGRYESGETYEGVVDAAFSLAVGSYSDVLTDRDGMYYIVYRMQKDSSYIDSHYSEIMESYQYNSLYRSILERTEQIISSASFTDLYSSYMSNPSSVKMG